VGGDNATGWAVRSACGVTLAEVTTALALFAVMMLAAVPIMPRLLAAYQLRGATQHVYAELQQARVAAVMENKRYRVRVLDGSRSFIVHDDENGDDQENDGIGTVTTRSLEVDAPSVVLTADGPVSFAPNGTVRIPRRIHLTNAVGDTSVVAVSTGGRIRIE
jgi:Tfp pilus assembly protein FimT